MRRVQKVLTGIFLSGILMGGIGTGIAMVEYSSLAYGGEKLIGEESLVTKNLDYEFQMGEGTLELAGFHYWNREKIQEIEVDVTVPVGTVRYEVTYNEKSISPSLVFEPYVEEEEELEVGEWEEPEDEAVNEDGDAAGDPDTAQTVSVDGESPAAALEDALIQEESGKKEKEESKRLGYLYLSASYHEDGFGVFMENKDRVLEELKQGKISSYRMAYITDVKIKVNPETVPYIESCYVTR